MVIDTSVRTTFISTSLGKGFGAVICASLFCGVGGGVSLCSGAWLIGCVPPGNATADDAGAAQGSGAAAGLLPKAAPNVLTTVFEDNFDRPDSGALSPANIERLKGPDNGAAMTGDASAEGPSAAKDGGVMGAAGDAGVQMRRVVEVLPDGGMMLKTVPVQNMSPGDLGNLGPNWYQAQTQAWHIEDGWLCVENAKNHGVWFARPIPVNARIEFDAKSDSPEGDLKAELWGDGRGFAKGTSYNDATSYLAILGGWKNTLHVLARLDEHKDDRKVVHVDKESDDPRQRPVMRGQVYHFKLERNDAKTLRYYVDGLLYATFADAEPLMGPGHDHFGFNDWEAKVCFDNVKITPL
jgi:hypothetical protein